MKVNAGVPQGSVLGPLLFLIYINDLTDNISCEMRLFADDSSLFTRVTSTDLTHAMIVKDLETINTWAYQWKMLFNPDITKQAIEVIFSTKKTDVQHPPLLFKGIPVSREMHTRLPGLFQPSKVPFVEILECIRNGLSVGEIKMIMKMCVKFKIILIK